MTADQVKEALLELHECQADFTVIFSGKKNKRANGSYKLSTKEITIHNLNFVGEDGRVADNSLMYTAIHELAHHIIDTEIGKLKRPHSPVFWAAFYDLLDKAEEKGIYRSEVDEETQKLIDEARQISVEIAALQRKLGGVLLKIEAACAEKGYRPEAIIEREVQLSKQTEKELKTAASLELPETVGVDVQAAVLKERDKDKQAALINTACQEGKSIVQAKKPTAPAKPVDAEDQTASLLREKQRIERTIENLNRRLAEVSEQLRSREGDQRTLDLSLA